MFPGELLLLRESVRSRHSRSVRGKGPPLTRRGLAIGQNIAESITRASGAHDNIKRPTTHEKQNRKYGIKALRVEV